MRLRPFLLDEWLDRYHAVPIRYDLASSTGPSFTFAQLRELATEDERRRLDDVPLTYGHASGAPELREEVAAMYACAPDEVIVTTGAEEALHIVFFTAAEPGANVVVPAPAFPPLHALPEALDLEVRAYGLRPENGFRIDPGEVERLVDARTRLLIVNSPHNPTGAVIGDDEKRALVALAEKRGVPVVSDEVYHPLYYGEPLASAAALPGVIAVGDLSKALCLSGLRLGFIVERDPRRREQYLRARMYFTITGPALSEALGVIALRHREPILERARRVARRNLEALGDAFSRQRALVGLVPPAGGTTVFPWLTFADDSRPFCEALAGEGVLLVPGDCFGAPRHFRLGFAASPDLPEALPIIEDRLSACSG